MTVGGMDHVELGEMVTFGLELVGLEEFCLGRYMKVTGRKHVELRKIDIAGT
jgi:hypothetical protein